MIRGTFMLVHLSFSWFWQNLNDSSKSINLFTHNQPKVKMPGCPQTDKDDTKGGGKTPLLSPMCAEQEGSMKASMLGSSIL